MRITIISKWLTLGILLIVFAGGCANLGQVQTQGITSVSPAELPSGNGWWRVRIRMNWPLETDPIWYMDLYHAHQVFRPLLDKHGSEIYLWRFHRRAKRDSAGRQFSFIFYSSPRTALQLFESLQSNPVLTHNISSGVIDEIVYDNPANIKQPDLDDTSDKNWPLAIQKTWPYYITGVSQMWLNLVVEIAERDLRDNRPTSLAEIESFYQQVDDTVTRLWQQNGRHAFLHHLNAVFGYQPLIYYEKRYMNF